MYSPPYAYTQPPYDPYFHHHSHHTSQPQPHLPSFPQWLTPQPEPYFPSFPTWPTPQPPPKPPPQPFYSATQISYHNSQIWEEYPTLDGRKYYYNTFTKEYTWTPPFVPPEEPPPCPPTPSQPPPFQNLTPQASHPPVSDLFEELRELVLKLREDLMVKPIQISSTADHGASPHPPPSKPPSPPPWTPPPSLPLETTFRKKEGKHSLSQTHKENEEPDLFKKRKYDIESEICIGKKIEEKKVKSLGSGNISGEETDKLHQKMWSIVIIKDWDDKVQSQPSTESTKQSQPFLTGPRCTIRVQPFLQITLRHVASSSTNLELWGIQRKGSTEVSARFADASSVVANPDVKYGPATAAVLEPHDLSSLCSPIQPTCAIVAKSSRNENGIILVLESLSKSSYFGLVFDAARKTMARMLGNNEAVFNSTKSQFWDVDAKGLITEGRENVDPDALPFARNLKEMDRQGLREGASLVEVVKQVKLDVLLGLSVVGGLFSKEVLEALKGSTSTRPAIFAMSNPTKNAECTPEEAFSILGFSMDQSVRQNLMDQILDFMDQFSNLEDKVDFKGVGNDRMLDIIYVMRFIREGIG